ncbi:MAG: hypothetical protein ACREK6_01270 [Candidatus Rokuibacteriota bacterium]
MSRSSPNPGGEQTARNRRVARIVLSIMAALAVATLLSGIRW